jgi:hypothetical protein
VLHPPLNVLLEQILVLAKKRDEEFRKFFSEQGAFYVASAGKVMEFKKRGALNAPLLKYLDIVSDDGLRKILAVMYYGKNEDDNYSDIYSELRTCDRALCISKLMENMSLFQYLRDGKARVEGGGLSLEKL